MRAVLVSPPRAGARLGERERPERPEGWARVAVQEVGVCGTDRDIAAGKYGRAPDGRTDLVLGHENVGRVVEPAESGGSAGKGELVVASVRRGCGSCRMCLGDRSDLCETGRFRERGISGLDGYWTEEYVERPEYLHRIPPGLAGVAVLLEPLTVVEKALRVAREVQSGRLPAGTTPSPLRALVAGSGAVGMLAAGALAARGASVTVVDRHPGETPAAQRIERLGAVHATADALPPVGAGPGYHLILEATGALDLPLTLGRRLAPNGVLVLTGIPPADAPAAPAELGAWARDVVLGNRLVVGSVNAAGVDFEQGIRDLAELEARWAGWLGGLITARRDLAEAPEVLSGRVDGEIKTVLRVRR